MAISTSQVAMRGTVVVLVFLYFHVSAGLDILADMPQSWGQNWRMFHAYGIDVCDVKYFDEEGTRIDRYKVLGETPMWRAKLHTRRISNKRGVVAQAHQICRRLPAPAFVTAEARCGHRSGWRTAYRQGENLCKTAIPRKPQK